MRVKIAADTSEPGRNRGMILRAKEPWCLALLVAVTAAIALPACQQRPAPDRAELTKVTIAATNLPASAPIYVADERGFFREEGLDADVETYAAGRLALEAALEGRADFATVADTPIVGAVVEGERPIVVATVAEIDSANVVVARRDRGISQASDLGGKRVGVIPGTSADFFLHIYLATSGVDESRVEEVSLEPDQVVPALVDGRVDAISAFAPYTLEAQDRLGSNAVVLDQPGLYTTFWNVTVPGGERRPDRDTVIRLLRGVERANDYVAENPAEAQEITADRTGTGVQAIARQWSANRWGLELTQPLILTLEDEWRWMTGESMPPSFLDYVETEPLRAVRPDAVTIVEPRD